MARLTKEELLELYNEEREKSSKLQEKISKLQLQKSKSDTKMADYKRQIDDIDKDIAFDWRKETLARLSEVGLGMSDLEALINKAIEEKKADAEEDELLAEMQEGNINAGYVQN